PNPLSQARSLPHPPSPRPPGILHARAPPESHTEAAFTAAPSPDSTERSLVYLTRARAPGFATPVPPPESHIEAAFTAAPSPDSTERSPLYRDPGTGTRLGESEGGVALRFNSARPCPAATRRGGCSGDAVATPQVYVKLLRESGR